MRFPLNVNHVPKAHVDCTRFFNRLSSNFRSRICENNQLHILLYLNLFIPQIPSQVFSITSWKAQMLLHFIFHSEYFVSYFKCRNVLLSEFLRFWSFQLIYFFVPCFEFRIFKMITWTWVSLLYWTQSVAIYCIHHHQLPIMSHCYTLVSSLYITLLLGNSDFSQCEIIYAALQSTVEYLNLYNIDLVHVMWLDS